MLRLSLNHKDPHANGLEHGETFRTKIHELANIRRGLLQNYLPNFSVEKIDELALAHVQVLKRTRSLYEEFCGIARGAAISSVDLMILNNYTDMRDFSTSTVRGMKRDTGGCSIFGVASERGRYFGQTWDMHGSATDYMLLLKLKHPFSTHVLTVTGCLGLCGVNTHGVGVLINNLHCGQARTKLAWGPMVRGMLMQKTEAGALGFLKKHPPSSGHNYLICGPKEMINVETTGLTHELTQRTKDPAAVFHTNHYLGKLKRTEITSRLSPSTKVRLKDLIQYFGHRPNPNGKELLGDLLSGRKAKSVSIKRDKKHPHKSATCGGILVDLKTRRGLVYSGPYKPSTRLVRFGL